METPITADTIYADTMAGLRSAIETQHGTIKAFCEAQSPPIDRHNLSKVLGTTNPREMSVGLFMRVSVGLGLMAAHTINPAIYGCDVRLRDYLAVDNNAVHRAILHVHFL